MPRLSDQRWQALIDAYYRSDLSQREFALRHGLNIHTFRARLYRPHAAVSSPADVPSPFVELRVVEPAAHRAAALSLPSALVVAHGEARLDFAELPDPGWLVDFLRQLAGETS